MYKSYQHEKDYAGAKSYIDQLKDIKEQDLKYIEKDLAFYEKVSLVFLLYGSDTLQAKHVLQNLIVLSRSPKENTELLYTFVTKFDIKEWKQFLVESLIIIKSNKVLRKLGFDINELREVFLPHIPQASLYVHPILKALYIMCERLTRSKASRLIHEMQNLAEFNDTLQFHDSRYLEIFLLHWIINSKISIGDYFTSSSIVHSKKLDINLLPLCQCLKLLDLDDVKYMLCSCEEQVKKKKEIKLRENTQKQLQQHKQLNINENDSALNGNNFERKESYAIIYDERYKISKIWAGFILIINQEKFYRDTNPEVEDMLPKEPLHDRRGTEMDKIYLEETFSLFGYRSVVKCNQTNNQMLNEIRDIVERSKIYDSIIVCILSHGFEGHVYGSNSIPVEIQNIQQILASENLLGKPKLLIIQACQGENLQKAKVVNKLEKDAPLDSVPRFSDMLTATSTVPGFASIRHIEKGSWFIQTLCKLIKDQGDRKHMLDILTSVIKEVSTKRGSENQCMVPQTQSTLSKSLFLPKIR